MKRLPWSFQKEGIPLRPFVTLVLTGILLVLGSGLFAVFHVIVQAQVRASLHAESVEWIDSLVSSSSKVLWNFDEAAVLTLGDAAASNPLVLNLEIWNDQKLLAYRHERSGPTLETLERPVMFGKDVAGSIRMTTDERLVAVRMAALEVPVFLAGAVFLLLLIVVTPFVLGRSVLDPIHRLGGLLSSADPRTLSDSALTTKSSIQEVRAVESALRMLAAAVRTNVQTLEEKVVERTADLRAARDQLAHAEALATLGQLTSGIAHELNTPLGAILSANQTFRQEVLDGMLHLLSMRLDPQLLEDRVGFLRQVTAASSALSTRRNPKEKARFREAWVRAGRDPETELFDLLSTDALYPIGHQVAGWPADEEHDAVLKWAILAAELLEIVHVAGEKAAHVVEALRGHLLQVSVEPSAWFNAQASIRPLLETFAAQKTHLKVEFLSPHGLAFYGPERRLVQVFGNLIRNAFQAVGLEGWIVVTAEVSGGWQTLRVADSGPHVPESVQKRLFEPYFTTHTSALGLGLHLSRSILDVLGGTVEYSEDGGQKAFLARWPVPADAEAKPLRGPVGS
ncbi:MAG: sensor histidine kinase [Spirochaetales bacterium]